MTEMEKMQQYINDLSCQEFERAWKNIMSKSRPPKGIWQLTDEQGQWSDGSTPIFNVQSLETRLRKLRKLLLL